jgi:hypothetical protein
MAYGHVDSIAGPVTRGKIWRKGHVSSAGSVWRFAVASQANPLYFSYIELIKLLYSALIINLVD